MGKLRYKTFSVNTPTPDTDPNESVSTFPMDPV